MNKKQICKSWLVSRCRYGPVKCRQYHPESTQKQLNNLYYYISAHISSNCSEDTVGKVTAMIIGRMSIDDKKTRIYVDTEYHTLYVNNNIYDIDELIEMCIDVLNGKNTTFDEEEKYISDNNLVIPEYKIELLNRNKKIINKIENIEKIENITTKRYYDKKQFINKKNFKPMNKFKRKFKYNPKINKKDLKIKN